MVRGWQLRRGRWCGRGSCGSRGCIYLTTSSRYAHERYTNVSEPCCHYLDLRESLVLRIASRAKFCSPAMRVRKMFDGMPRVRTPVCH